MRRPRMRPDFSLPIGPHGPRLYARLRAQLDDDACPFVGNVAGRHAVVRLPDGKASLLSPLLDLELLGGDETELVLRGRFTPQPNVWTGFMAVYATIGLLGLAGSMYGFAQITVDEKPWWLLAGPASLALIAFVYGAAFIGQGLSVDEMYALRAFVDRALREEGLAADTTGDGVPAAGTNS